MESLNIGKHLKNIRQNRELSLDEAAEIDRCEQASARTD